MAEILKYVNDSKITGFTISENDIMELQDVQDNAYKWVSTNYINCNNLTAKNFTTPILRYSTYTSVHMRIIKPSPNSKNDQLYV